jgi:hypothetical protein
MKMVVDCLQGRKVTSAWGIPASLEEDWKGKKKDMSDLDLHRLILKLLIFSVFEEEFIKSRGPQ